MLSRRSSPSVMMSMPGDFLILDGGLYGGVVDFVEIVARDAAGEIVGLEPLEPAAAWRSCRRSQWEEWEESFKLVYSRRVVYRMEVLRIRAVFKGAEMHIIALALRYLF